MIDIKSFMFKEFGVTEEQAQEQAKNFLSKINFYTVIIQFREVIQQLTPAGVDKMVQYVTSVVNPPISEQTMRDLYRQTCQGNDEVYKRSVMQNPADDPIATMYGLLEYLDPHNQECFIRKLYAETLKSKEKALDVVEPRGRTRSFSLNSLS